jgi:predicted TIM-barrel fold metal-dependent hydrolase
LRLVLAGVFDRFSQLQIILGHMGENIPFSLARADEFLSRSAPHLKWSVAEYFHRNFHITTSGYFTVPPFLCALMVMGADRMMFSVDYPFYSAAKGTAFLDSAPVTTADRHKIAHANAEQLLHISPASVA